MHDLGVKPANHIGDGAKALSKAGREVFSDLERCHRLMCWSHVHRNIVPKLKTIGTFNKELAGNILNGIVDLQWSVHNEASFRKVYSLLEKKYLGKHSQVVNATLAKFFAYMRSVWIESEEFRWYEGAHPWHISNNQGVEGKNKNIKESHTFRRRLELGELFDVMLRMVKEWSEEDDSLLHSSRLASLQNQKNSLKLRTEGYQWSRRNKNMLTFKIDPKGKYTVSESNEFLLGKVDNIWSIERSNDKSGKTLKERTKIRIKERSVPSSSTFDEYMSTRTSCWILEERDGDFYCDCPKGMKGKMCCHTVGMQYKEGHFEPTSDVRAVPLGAKRRKGRPKKLPNCLAPSPVQSRNPQVIFETNAGRETSAVIEPVAPLKKTTRKKRKAPAEEMEELNDVDQSPVVALHRQIHAGLGASKPPKKRCKTIPNVTNHEQLASKTNEPSVSKSSTSKVQKPKPVLCKKKKDSCKHIVAFGDHYNENAWNKYSSYVKSLSCITEVDPDYIS